MTKYEELKKIICEALPRLYEIQENQIFEYIPNKKTKLKWDAKIFIVSGAGQIADTGDYGDVYVDFHSYHNGFEMLPIDEIEDFEILGIDPTLSDVLQYLKETTDTELTLSVFGLYITDDITWNLSQPLLKDQSEELIDYLLTIKK